MRPWKPYWLSDDKNSSSIITNGIFRHELIIPKKCSDHGLGTFSFGFSFGAFFTAPFYVKGTIKKEYMGSKQYRSKTGVI